MKKEDLFEALGELDDSIINGAILEVPGSISLPKKRAKISWKLWGAAAACIVLALILNATFLPFHSKIPVSVYARDTDMEITAAGVMLDTGTISDNGEMRGHPLMFYLSGERIASVRFSCKNQQLNFMDWTERREEYGNAQNFTVTYGEDESEYYYLTINWIPETIIRELTDNPDSTIASLSEEMRKDLIVLEIIFENGETATKAIEISLLDDGTFYASVNDYRISKADTFVHRPDSEAIPRKILYAQGEVVGSTADAPPMVCINGRLYQQSGQLAASLGEDGMETVESLWESLQNDCIYLGKIQSDITHDQQSTDGVPRENFQANLPIVGAEVWQYGDYLVVISDGEYWLYKILANENVSEGQRESSALLDPSYQ